MSHRVWHGTETTSAAPSSEVLVLPTHVGFGNPGGTISGYLLLARDGPRYLLIHSTLLAFRFMACCLSVFMTTYLRRENARRDREYKPPSAYIEEEKMTEREKGDNATFFRYTM
jgi:hypothetical protein